MIKKIVIFSFLIFAQIKSTQDYFSIQFMCYADKAKCIKYNLDNIRIEHSKKETGEEYCHSPKQFNFENVNEFSDFAIEIDYTKPYRNINKLKLIERSYVKFDREIEFKYLFTHEFNYKNILLYDNSNKLIAKFKIQMYKKHTIFLDQVESEIKVLSVHYN